MRHSSALKSKAYALIVTLSTSILPGCSTGTTGNWRAGDFFSDQNVIALANAAGSGDIKEIDRLISAGTDVNVRGKDGMTPLLWAMWAKSKPGFRHLLERGADPNLQVTGGRGKGSSVTSLSALAANDSEWLELVLKHGANPNLVNPEGASACMSTTPIFDAVLSRRQKNLELLIKAGANLNFQDACGNTPAMLAATLNLFDTVYKLLDAGADYRLADKAGYDLADCVADSRVDPKLDGGLREKVISFMSKKGVDFDDVRKKLIEKHKHAAIKLDENGNWVPNTE